MIRIDALAWAVILALLGVGLFQVKYDVQTREAELRQVRKQIESNYSAIRVLEAEWSYLNDLARLTDLARRHTELAPTMPGQIKEFADLPARQPDAPASEEDAPLLLSEGESEMAPLTSPDSLDEAMIDAILAEMQAEETAPETMAVSAGDGEGE